MLPVPLAGLVGAMRTVPLSGQTWCLYWGRFRVLPLAAALFAENAPIEKLGTDVNSDKLSLRAGAPTALRAFDVNLAALLQVFLAALRCLAEDHDVVPVNPLLALTLLVGIGLVGRDRKARQRPPGLGKMPQFRVLTKMANQSYSIQRHFFSSFILRAHRLQPGLRALLSLFACSRIRVGRPSTLPLRRRACLLT